MEKMLDRSTQAVPAATGTDFGPDDIARLTSRVATLEAFVHALREALIAAGREIDDLSTAAEDAARRIERMERQLG